MNFICQCQRCVSQYRIYVRLIHAVNRYTFAYNLTLSDRFIRNSNNAGDKPTQQ